MSGHWLSERIEAVCRPEGGGTPSRQNHRFWRGTIPWASVKDFKEAQRFIYDTEEHITDAGLKGSASRLIPAGIPLVCTRMAVGRSAISVRDVAINQDVKALFPTGRLDSNYLQRLLEFHEDDLGRTAVGSTVKGISTAELLRFPIRYPEQAVERSRIAKILDTVDEAIRETALIVAKVRHVNAGLLDDLLKYGLDASGHLRDLARYPGHFKDSPLGRIPNAWRTPTIGEMACHVRSGVTPTGGSAVYQKQGITFVRSQNVTFAGLLLNDVVYITPAIHAAMSRSEIFPFDVLLNITGASIGRCCYVPTHFPTANVNQHVCVIRLPKPRLVDAVLLAAILASPIGQSQIDRLNAGGNREGLNYAQVRKFLVPWPELEERDLVAKLLEHARSRLEAEESMLRKFQSIKLGLSHDLLTGRVRVKI